MQSLRPIISRFAVLGFLVAAAIGIAAPQRVAAQLPSADLAILRITGPHHAKVGRVVTVRIEASNLGPASSQLDVHVTTSDGLELNFLQCDLGISADGPFCEYSNVAPGSRRTTLAVATALTGAGSPGTLTACTNNEGQTEDPNASNNCATFTIGIIGE